MGTDVALARGTNPVSGGWQGFGRFDDSDRPVYSVHEGAALALVDNGAVPWPGRLGAELLATPRPIRALATAGETGISLASAQRALLPNQVSGEAGKARLPRVAVRKAALLLGDESSEAASSSSVALASPRGNFCADTVNAPVGSVAGGTDAAVQCVESAGVEISLIPKAPFRIEEI